MIKGVGRGGPNFDYEFVDLFSLEISQGVGDGVHLTTGDYNKVANQIFDTLKRKIE